jgi:hypothetical protein
MGELRLIRQGITNATNSRVETMAAVAETSDIHAMLGFLQPSPSQQPGQHQIAFKVGKIGRVDRFVLRIADPSVRREVFQLCTEPGAGTENVLAVLDELVEHDATLGMLYNNPRDPRYAYCMWTRMIRRKDWARCRILPIYRTRMSEQLRICRGDITRGHREFGFLPLDGHA